MGNTKKQLTAAQQKELLTTLKARFEKHNGRHKGIAWNDVEKKLKSNSDKLWSLYQMEETGGEPDVVVLDKKSAAYMFVDCAAESPSGRRSVAFDREGLESRKEHRPADSAMDMAEAMGIELLDEEQYRELQKLGKFDLKTSSWLKTPPEMRKLGGALFGDLRFGRVFVYHNGAQSYYAARGFRGCISI